MSTQKGSTEPRNTKQEDKGLEEEEKMKLSLIDDCAWLNLHVMRRCSKQAEIHVMTQANEVLLGEDRVGDLKSC